MGSAKSLYAKMLRSLLTDNMIWIDHVDHGSEELVAAYSRARLFASVSWAEGASLSLLEACAAGLPLIAHDTGSEREYFGDEPIYVRASDIDDIRSQVSEVFHREAGTCAGNAIATKYSWDSHVSKISGLYSMLINTESKSK